MNKYEGAHHCDPSDVGFPAALEKVIGGGGVLRHNRTVLILRKVKMFTEFIVSSVSSVPSGSYAATFTAIDPFESNVEQFGEAVILRFEIASGEYEGQEASRICSKRFSTKSNLYGFAKAMFGGELKRGDKFDFAQHIGAKGLIVVEETESGATRVATFLRAAD